MALLSWPSVELPVMLLELELLLEPLVLSELAELLQCWEVWDWWELLELQG